MAFALQESPHNAATNAERRRFGLMVGSVLALIGGWRLFRQHESFTLSLIVIGSVLVVLGIAVPRALAGVQRVWMRVGEALGLVMTGVILLAGFLFVVTPIGLLRKAAGADPLRRKRRRAESYWEEYPVRQRDHYEKMF